jgi:transposase-like protein
VLKLRQVEVLQGQGKSVQDAVRQIGVTVQTYDRWRKEYSGMSRDQLKRLKELETGNQRLRRAVSDRTLDKLNLTEAARGNFSALRAAVSVLTMCGRPLAYLSVGSAAHGDSTDPLSARCAVASQMKSG